MRPLLMGFVIALFWARMLTGLLQASPPVLHRFTIPSPVAELGDGSVALPFELEFTSPDELALFVLSFRSPDGDVFEHPFLLRPLENSVTGSLKGGIFRQNIRVPGYRAANTWAISVRMSDFGGGITELAGLPEGSTQTLTTTNGGVVDRIPPVLTSAVLAPGAVDITAGPQLVTFTLTAQDDSGIEYLNLSLEDSAGRTRTGGHLTAMERIAGTAQSGTWRGSFSVPALGPAGSYKLSYSLNDQSQRYSYHGSESLPDPNIPTTLAVTTSGPVDTASPVLTTISASRQEVDVTDEAQTVRLDLTAVDSPGGIRSINATLSDPDGNGQSQSAYYDESAPYSTEPVGGTAEFRIPRYTPPGLYRWMVNIGDGADFSSSYGHEALPFPAVFGGTLQVVNNGLTRGTPPVAASFSRHPASLPEGALPGLLEYTVQVNDPAAITNVTGFLFRTPVTTGSARNEFPLTLIAGTPQKGTWQGRVKLGRNNLPGDYVTGFRVSDVTGDTATFGAWPSYAVPYPVAWEKNFSITVGGPALTAYQSWRLGYFSDTAANAGEADDPDGDGWPNALEFMLEMNPLSASPTGVNDLSTAGPRIRWSPETRQLAFIPSLLNPTLGTGNNLKIKGWKSSLLAPGSWAAVPSNFLTFGERFFQLEPPSFSRPQQFLRLSVEP